MSKHIYVAGPMTGIPLYNWPAFEAATEKLRRLGNTVISPTEIDEDLGVVEVTVSDGEIVDVEITDAFDFERVLAKDLEALATCDTIYLLVGWEHSYGACRELAFALDNGITVSHEPRALRYTELVGTLEDRIKVNGRLRKLLTTPVPWDPSDPGTLYWNPAAQEWQAEAIAALDEAADTGNPKDLIGDTKAPMHLVPPAAVARMAKVMELGAQKYGPYNWREKAVRSTVYISAAARHLAAYLDGETVDPESGQPHTAHVAACMAIILDATDHGNLVDDRPVAGPAAAVLREVAT